MENLLTVFRQVAVLFVLMGAGFAARRMKLLGDAAVEGCANLLMMLVTPCVIIDCFQRPFDQAMLGGLALAFLIASIGHIAAIAAVPFVVRHRNDDTRRTLLIAAVFSNAGFMGIPLEQSILGDEGVFYGVVYVVVFNLFSTSLPSAVALPVRHMANLNTPLAMIVVGYSLAGAKLGRVARMPSAYAAAFVRLVAYPVVLIAAMYPFRAHLDREMMLALAIAGAAPVAAMVSMFAVKFKRDVDVSVAVVSATTLVSVVTIPLVVAFAMAVL